MDSFSIARQLLDSREKEFLGQFKEKDNGNPPDDS
jgi:hypothetical protein